MKKFLVSLLILGIIPVSAQMVNFNLSGAGARAMGMGGAFIGVADDATAISWNPAGLIQLERPEVSLVTRFIADSYKEEWYGDEYEENQEHFVLNFLSAALPVDIGKSRMVAAFALQRQIDLYAKGIDYDYYGNEYDFEGKGGVDSFTLAGGFKFAPWLYTGLAANIWAGSYEYKENYRADYKYTEDYSGFNLVAGLMVDLKGLDNPVPVKFGTVFRTPFNLELEMKDDFGKDTDTIEMPVMVGFGISIQPNELFTIAADYELRNYTESGFPYDINQLRTGIEGLFITDFAVIPVRAGFFTHPTFLDNEDGDQLNGVGLSLGTGLIFERFALDLGLSGNSAIIEHDADFTQTFTQGILAISAIFYF